MIIMFIFLGLTVVFVICTAIYLNKKKSQNGFTKNTSGDQCKKVDKKKLENIFKLKGVNYTPFLLRISISL